MKVALCVLTLALCASSSDKIAPAQAKDHVGKHAAVCGLVASANFATRSSRQPTFLLQESEQLRLD